MSKLGANDIKIIDFQDDVDSYPLRTNFENIKNALNDNQNQIDNISGAESTNEVVQGRDYYDSLRERVRAGDKDYNFRITGGVVTVNADTSKVDISAFEGIAAGVGVDIDSGTSASVTAAASNKHRVDIAVANSDNTFTILTGSESDDAATNPVTPAIASSQIPLALLYVDDGAIDLTGHIYALSGQTDYQIQYIKNSASIRSGNYILGDFILDDTVTLDTRDFPAAILTSMNQQFVAMKCKGNFHMTAAASISFSAVSTDFGNTNPGDAGLKNIAGTGGAAGGVTLTSFKVININYASNKGADGVDASSLTDEIWSGGGGGGGASWVAPGGDGGNGVTLGGSGIHIGYDASAGGVSNTNMAPYLVIQAENIEINGVINLSGKDGLQGVDFVAAQTSAAAGAGSGGSGGGTLILSASQDITIGVSSHVIANGGDGGNGGDVSGATANNFGGGGGGGGGGGLIMIRSKTYTNSGTVTAAAGAGGAAGTGTTGTNPVNGTAGNLATGGYVDQSLVLNDANIEHTIMPINSGGIGWDIFRR